MREWLADPKANRANRQARLDGLAELLGLDVADLDDIPYQLLHRAAVPLLEANRFNADHAVLVVHSFSSEAEHLDEYQAFTRLFGAAGEPGAVERAGRREGVELHFCWVSDQARSQAHQGEPEPVLLEALDWLRDTYRAHRFFKERDVEAALQQRMTELFEESRSDWRVYENHRVPGKQLDLAVVDRCAPGEVALGIELKYEPAHARAGKDMRGDTAKFPVCLAEEIKKDVQQLERCVAEGLIEVGYALLIDEGGYRRTRGTPPQGERQLWGKDTGTRMAPARYVTRAGAVLRELRPAIVERGLEEPEDDPEHCVADRRLAEGSGVGGELWQLFAGGVVAVDQHRHGPGRDVLDEARQQAAKDRRPRQGRLEPRVSGAQDRAVLHVEREADGLPGVAARHELAQNFDVVVF